MSQFEAMTKKIGRSSQSASQVTMRDVARAAGVSRMTVSRALRDNSTISEHTRRRILQLVQEMNYVPDQMASSLSTRSYGFVGVLLPSLNNLHFAQTVQALTDELDGTGLQVLLGYTGYSAQKEEQVVESMLGRRPDAMVLSYDGHTSRTRRLLEQANIPVIEIWEKPENPIDCTVGFSNFEAAYSMTSALAGRGFSNIVFLCEGSDDWTRGAQRRKGFRQAMLDHQLSPENILRVGSPPLRIEDGANAAAILEQTFPAVECVFCVSDQAAFGLLNGLMARGVRVPEDISVVGFGNFEVAQYSSPGISTVVVDPIAIGRKSGQLIKKLLQAPDADSPKEFLVPTSIVFRESTRNEGTSD